jgi:hypothetical protein
MVPSTKLGGLWRVYPEDRDTHHDRVRCTDRERRPGDTELPRLTSDSIVYGGPQGWNPHFLRTRRLPGKGIKPFEPQASAGNRAGGPETAERVERPADRVVLCPHLIRSALEHLRASDSIGAGIRIRRTVFRSDVMGQYYLTAPNRIDAIRRPITPPAFPRAGSRPEGARRRRAAPFTLNRSRVLHLRPSNCRRWVSGYHATVFHDDAPPPKGCRAAGGQPVIPRCRRRGSGWVVTAHVPLRPVDH